MIAVVIPAHNEEDLLPDCLRSIRHAARDPALREPVLAIVVLDDCTDRSEEIARRAGATVLKTGTRCVGRARSAGCDFAVRQGARWMACTDADSRVPGDWLSRQLRHRADLVCGIVAVADWSMHSAATRLRYDLAYTSTDGHRHIHGANLGFSARLYRAAGGFPPLCTGEDVAFVEAAEKIRAHIAWVADPCVLTAARLDYRAPLGFGAYLQGLTKNPPLLARVA